MTPLNKIVAVTSQGGYTTTAHGGQRLTATASSFSGGTGNSTFSAYGNSQYNYYMSSLLPATPEIADNAGLLYFYRDIYLHDNTAGSCVDIMSTFPFSDFEIRGLEGHHLKIFNDALARLNVPGLMPQASVSTLVDGFTASTLIYDAQAKNFMDVLTYDAMSCSVIPSPLHNLDPAITVSVGGQLQQFVEQAGDYAKEYLSRMPASFVELLKAGAFRLDPVTTLFFGRKTLADRAYVSYLHRILPMYLIEKTMYRGTLTEANRRQRAMSQITAGDELWTPTDEELLALVKQFQLAEQDPMGGWIGTRSSVAVSDLRPAGEFWKWTDMTDQMVQYKLRALGVSEALLSGDACLVGGTQVARTDGTTTSIESLCPEPTAMPSSLPIGKWFPLETEIPNRVASSAKTKAWSYQGHRETFTLSTEDGKEITATDNHPFWVMDALTGECCWRRLDEIKEGDLVAVKD